MVYVQVKNPDQTWEFVLQLVQQNFIVDFIGSCLYTGGWSEEGCCTPLNSAFAIRDLEI